jgi:hypothetical protein
LILFVICEGTRNPSSVMSSVIGVASAAWIINHQRVLFHRNTSLLFVMTMALSCSISVYYPPRATSRLVASGTRAVSDSAILRTSLRTQGLGIYEHPSTQWSRHVRPGRRAAAAGYVSMGKTTQNLRRNYISLVLAALYILASRGGKRARAKDSQPTPPNSYIGLDF